MGEGSLSKERVRIVHRKEWKMEKRCSFELFKSNVCHRLKEQGDIDFLIETLKEDMIRQYYDKKWYPESFYLLAMVDYTVEKQCAYLQLIR